MPLGHETMLGWRTMTGQTCLKEQNMSSTSNVFLMAHGARQILPGRDADGVTPRGELAPTCVSIAAVATFPASVDVRS